MTFASATDLKRVEVNALKQHGQDSAEEVFRKVTRSTAPSRHSEIQVDLVKISANFHRSKCAECWWFPFEAEH